MVKILENNSTKLLVNGSNNLKKLKSKDLVHPDESIVLLPYFDELSDELNKNLMHIINGIISSVITENIFDSSDYFQQLNRFIDSFGMHLSKKVLFDLTQFFIEQMIKKKQSKEIIKNCSKSINKLYSNIRFAQFDHNDFIIDWKPLYEFCLLVKNHKISGISVTDLSSPISSLSPFFEPQQQPIIWERLQELLTYDSSMKYFIDFCYMFLTVEGMSSEEHKKYGCSIWFDTLWDLYLTIEMNYTESFTLIYKFKEILRNVPDVIDWNPYYDIIFTKVTRSFAIPTNKSIIGDTMDSICVNSFALFSCYSIGGPNSAIKHFEQTLKCVEFNVHPSNSGDHVSQIISFIKTFTSTFISRISYERINEHKRKVSKEYYLKDEEIDAVAKLLAGPVFMLLFCDHTSYSAFSSVLHDLSALNVNLIGGKLLEHVYSAIFALSEPERLSTTMDSTINIIFQIMRSSIDDLGRKCSTPIPNYWIEKMEEERMSWSTYREGSKMKQLTTHKYSSIRHHTIYLMEIYVNSIDVNDVGRAEASLKTLALIFRSIPVMDFSEALEYYSKGMTEDDKILCLLSKRIPIIVEEAFEKILKAIGHLAVCAAKDSISNIGTMNDTVSKDGEEEKLLKYAITTCVEALFTNSNQKLTDKLFDRLFEFVSTIEFESYTATDLLSGVIGSCLWISNKAWKKFADFILQKLKLVITPEVEKMKEAPSTVLYYAVLASSLFGVRANINIEHEDLICEIIQILWNCECLTAYAIAINGLTTTLSTLTKTCIYPEDELSEKLKSPISKWNPLEEWTKCYKYKDCNIIYFIPSKIELNCAQRISNRFFFPTIDKLDEKLDRDQMRKIISCVVAILKCVQENLKQPQSSILKTAINAHCLPYATGFLGNIEVIDWELRTPNGGNVMELLLNKIEKLIVRSDINDPQFFEMISMSCLVLIEQYSFKKVKYNLFEKEAVETYWNLTAPLHQEYFAILEKMQTISMRTNALVEKYANGCTLNATEFDLRVIKCLMKLGLNDYETVRANACASLAILDQKIFFCREYLMDDIIEVITDQVVENENKLRGSLELIISLNLADTSNAYIRSLIWEAMLKTKVIDEPKIRVLFDSFVESINSISNSGRPSKYEDCVDAPVIISNVAKQLFEESRLNEWKDYTTTDGLQNQRKTYLKWKKDCIDVRNNMVETILKNYIGNPNLHHTREKLARTMIYRCQRQLANTETIKLLLSQLIHEEETMRDEAGSELANYLYKNRKRLVEIDYKPNDGIGAILNSENKRVFGIRKDNLCTVYDSGNLPNNEQKWNDMVFFSKQTANFKWSENMKVNRQIDPFIEKIDEEGEKEIVKWFENEENVDNWLCLRLKNMDDHTSLNKDSIKIIRYVIRNYPSSQKTIQVMKNALIQLIGSKKKEHQSLAAEIFLSISLGIRYRPFKEIEEFWKWAAPTIDSFLDRMNTESKKEWKNAIDRILEDDFDQRRNWWLIEHLIEGSKKERIEEWKQAFRLEIISTTSCWRNIEIVNRVCEIAWKKMRVAVTDILRTGIANTLKTISLLKETNQNNDFDGIDQRFHIETTDDWISRFTENISLLGSSKTLKKVDTTSRKRPVPKSKSEEALLSEPPSKRKRGVSQSTSPETSSQIEAKKSILYFRTLLEFIQQYYSVCCQSWTPQIISLLPRLFEFSNESDYEISEDKDVDIIQNCSSLIHINMSVLLVPAKYSDSIIKTIIDTYNNNSYSWRVRLTIIKFVQVLVYSNMFELKKSGRREVFQQLLFDAISDISIDVRTEASKCLSLFIHCDYVVISDETIIKLNNVMNDKNEKIHERHGACLTLCAIVTAYPFSLPKSMIKPLQMLSCANAKLAIVQNTIKSALREFRQQHKDEWIKTKNVLGERMIFEIENAIVPIYYS
ncbi:unnamed protein product [Caenorhabditis angaria]|uniref:Proteasome activator complex subunit 4 C-terminal domain-containing protein n=1 Tax=Caenorhabditis angaria TaxID=860376 RepID=A0A9P1I826_9PELO|nr:unnamed protein product [Caenorhabditis angaria]